MHSNMRSFHVTRKDLIYFCFPFLSFRTKFYLSPISFNFPPHIFPTDRVHSVEGNGIKGLPFRKPIKKLNPVASVMGVISQIVIALDDFNFRFAIFRTKNLLFCLIDTAAMRISNGSGADIVQPKPDWIAFGVAYINTPFRCHMILSDYSINCRMYRKRRTVCAIIITVRRARHGMKIDFQSEEETE